MPWAFLSPRLMESRGIAWPCCPTTSCVWRSLPYRALGATAPDLRPPGRRSPPQKRKTSFHVFPPALERTRTPLSFRRVPLCSPCIRVPRIHAVLRSNAAQCRLPAPRVGVLTAHVGSPDYVFDISAHIPHTAASLAVEVEMRPRCGLYGERCRRGKPLSPPPSRRCWHMTPGHSIDTCPRHTLALTPSP